MKLNDQIVDRIQKLLSLANSDNENEAKLATQKANELLIKHNLSLQEIQDYQNEYGVEDALEIGLTIKLHQKLIFKIVQEYFFVRVMVFKKYIGLSSGKYSYYRPARAQYNKIIQLVGTKENCQIASYVLKYLNEAYPKLWKDYCDRNPKVEKSDRNSYYIGLTRGIMDMLRATKWKVENETGLVVLKDPKLDEFVAGITKELYSSSFKSDVNPDVVRDGIVHGRNVTLRKPIESQRTNENKYLQEYNK